MRGTIKRRKKKAVPSPGCFSSGGYFRIERLVLIFVKDRWQDRCGRISSPQQRIVEPVPTSKRVLAENFSASIASTASEKARATYSSKLQYNADAGLQKASGVMPKGIISMPHHHVLLCPVHTTARYSQCHCGKIIRNLEKDKLIENLLKTYLSHEQSSRRITKSLWLSSNVSDMQAFVPPSLQTVWLGTRVSAKGNVCLQGGSVPRNQCPITAPSPVPRWSCVSAIDAPEKTVPSGTQVRDEMWLVDQGKQSKIVCTIGPKTCSVESIEQLASRGMDVVRLNMSHGTHEWHKQVIANARAVREKGKYKLSILLDTKGPEVRSGDLKIPLKVERGDQFVWTIRSDFANEPRTVDVSYDDFVKDIHVGDLLLVDGGMSSFVCTKITDTDVITECVDGGVLTSRRHLNVRGKSASLPAITDKDWEDIKFGIENDVDFYALSFVKHQDDVIELKKYLEQRGVKALVLSKIESADAVKQLRPILEASDGAMVARGDLGAEIPIEDVPLVQEEIVSINRSLRRPTIVATHMLESMITYPTPTRAEVTDITEAVRQGADATMLSGETANGSYPMQAVEVMSTVASSVVTQDSILSESHLFSPVNRTRDGRESSDPRLDLAYAASTLASKVNAAAILVFTRSGTYARLVSSTRPRCPVIAFAPDAALVRRLTILWGVQPYFLNFDDDPEETTAKAIEFLKRRNLTAAKDSIVLTSDMLTKGNGKVNTIQVRRVH